MTRFAHIAGTAFALVSLMQSALHGLADAEPDLQAPAPQALRQEFNAELALIEQARLHGLQDILARRAETARQEYDETLRTRNVRAMAVARQTQSLVEQAQAQLRDKGKFELPAEVRRELADWRATLATEQAEVEQRAAERLARIRDAYAARLRAALGPAGASLSPEALAALLDRLVTAEPAPPTPADEPGTAPGTSPAPAEPAPPEESGDWAAARRPAAPPPPSAAGYFATSGEGADWAPVGRWMAAMAGRDVVEIPVLNAANTIREQKFNPIARGTSEWTYEPLMPVPMVHGSRYIFRLKSIPGQRTVDVLEWPSVANGGRLVVRTQPVAEVPSPHGFELELSGAARAEPVTLQPMLEIPVTTAPPGATIHINGIPYRDDSGRPVRTPCSIRVREGVYTIRLSLPDHLDKEVAGWRATPDGRIAWKFAHELTLPAQTARVEARPVWAPTEIQVQAGDRVWMIPSGRWSCGSQRETVGPEGYPETDRYRHYYDAEGAGLRQLETAPYGALLARVGPHADPIPVASTTVVTAVSSGYIYFDINEATEPRLRNNNRGQLDVKVIRVPRPR